MKAAIARDWADALESGRYEQATGVLGRIDPDTGQRSYCCLGVLCMLAIDDGVDIATELGNTHYIYFDDSLTQLPPAVCEWANTAENPWLGIGDAIHMNDDMDMSFRQIASAIREHLGEEVTHER